MTGRDDDNDDHDDLQDDGKARSFSYLYCYSPSPLPPPPPPPPPAFSTRPSRPGLGLLDDGQGLSSAALHRITTSGGSPLCCG